MKEVKKELRTVNVTLECDCGGQYKHTGVQLTSSPPKYPHVCDKCGDTVDSGKPYPRIEYEEAK